MPSTKEIRMKIKSVNNTRKITNAMQMVAASKMRKAQDRMFAARPYGSRIRTIISHLAASNTDYHHPFLASHNDAKKIGLILITTDKFQCVVAAVMSEGVVDDLQIIQVSQDQHTGFSGRFRTLQQHIGHPVEPTAVVYAGQFVGVGDQFQPAVVEPCLFQIALQLLDQTGHFDGGADLGRYGIDLGEVVIIQLADKQTVLLLIGEKRHHHKGIPSVSGHIAVGDAVVYGDLLFRRLDTLELLSDVIGLQIEILRHDPLFIQIGRAHV